MMVSFTGFEAASQFLTGEILEPGVVLGRERTRRSHGARWVFAFALA
jgi:hypothetical protein